jgi:hypothetical protein
MIEACRSGPIVAHVTEVRIAPSEDDGSLALTLKSRRESPCPLLMVVGAGDPPHQLGRGDVLEFARRHTLAQRLQRVVNRLHRGRERGVRLQRNPDSMRSEPIEIAELTAAAAEDQRDLDHR